MHSWCPRGVRNVLDVADCEVFVMGVYKNIHDLKQKRANAKQMIRFWCPKQESDLRLVFTKDVFYH